MTDWSVPIRSLLAHAQQFRINAHSVLGLHEAATSRVILLNQTYSRLDAFSISQDELFRQALRCTEVGLFRAAHVMGWAAFMDFLEQKLNEDGLKRLRAIRPKWTAATIEELRESVNEFQLIHAARELGTCTKNQAKALHGLLNKRNECAHPSDFYPGLNETLGYLTELLSRIDQLRKRSAAYIAGSGGP
jgi:hypothetical protein